MPAMRASTSGCGPARPEASPVVISYENAPALSASGAFSFWLSAGAAYITPAALAAWKASCAPSQIIFTATNAMSTRPK
jgi:hypothetical protein